MKKLYNRLYSDYFLPNRIGVYEQLNQKALDNGYSFKTLLEFYHENVINKTQAAKIFIHRHDIDTDVKTAARFFESEQRLGIKTSYYFRLNTIDIGLMQEIHAAGSEVGYHYEEIAQFCKDHKIKKWDNVVARMDEIREKFSENYLALQSKLGFKIKSIASHGDFVNRKLGHSNYELLTPTLKEKLGIELEGYNSDLLNMFNAVLSDQPYPKYYRDKTPDEAIDAAENVIYLLTHTRHWHVARGENTKDNFQRMWEGLKYKL